MGMLPGTCQPAHGVGDSGDAGAVHVPDDNVTIDPEFRTSGAHPDRDSKGGPPRPVIAGLVAVVAAAAVLLGSPDAPSSQRSEEIAADLASITDELTPPGLQAGAPAPGSLAAALGETVPGFGDTITIVIQRPDGGEVLRWLPSESAPASILAVDDEDGGRGRSIDASGRWFMELRTQDTLAVYTVADGNPRSHEPRPVSGLVGSIEAWSAAWHDSRPGSLAWIECTSEPTAPSVMIQIAQLGESRAAPIRARSLPLPAIPCDRGVELASWGEWGTLLHVADGAGIAQVLVDGNGTLSAQATHDSSARFVGVGPGGATAWAEMVAGAGATAYLVGPRGERAPLPGIAPGEEVERVLSAPDGSRLALVVARTSTTGSIVRIVDAATGAVVAEIPESGPWLDSMVWSSDGRFLVYERWPVVPPSRRGVPEQVELLVYDTIAATAVAIPLEGTSLSLRAAR